MNCPEVKVGTFLVRSIGSGCHDYYQVLRRTPATCTARAVQGKVITRNVRYQTYTDIPQKDAWYADSPFPHCDETVTVRLKPNGEIGPRKRMTWWSVWKDTPNEHFCA